MRPQTVGFGLVALMCLGAVLTGCGPDGKGGVGKFVDHVEYYGKQDGCSINKWITNGAHPNLYVISCPNSTVTARWSAGKNSSHTTITESD
jgi:hypothetical protein